MQLIKANVGLIYVVKKIFQTNRLQKQAGGVILISDKADFKPKLKERKKITSY
jgi:hypothetical protein